MSKNRPNAKITPPPSSADDLDMLTKLQNEKREVKLSDRQSSSVKKDSQVKEDPKEELKRIGLRFPASVVKRLKLHCVLTERSQNDVILEALVSFLDKHGEAL